MAFCEHSLNAEQHSPQSYPCYQAGQDGKGFLELRYLPEAGGAFALSLPSLEQDLVPSACRTTDLSLRTRKSLLFEMMDDVLLSLGSLIPC